MINLEAREAMVQLFYKYHKFLTPAQYQVLYLTYIEDLSLAEVAQVVATTRSAVYDAVKKGEKKLLKIEQQMS